MAAAAAACRRGTFQIWMQRAWQRRAWRGRLNGHLTRRRSAPVQPRKAYLCGNDDADRSSLPGSVVLCSRAKALLLLQGELTPHSGPETGEGGQNSGMFRPPESLNGPRMERMIPSMDCSENEESIDGVMRSIRALLNDSGGQNMPRGLAAFTGFLPHCAPAPPLGQVARPSRGGGLILSPVLCRCFAGSECV